VKHQYYIALFYHEKEYSHEVNTDFAFNARVILDVPLIAN